jgi:hypothetical protein
VADQNYVVASIEYRTVPERGVRQAGRGQYPPMFTSGTTDSLSRTGY